VSAVTAGLKPFALEPETIRLAFVDKPLADNVGQFYQQVLERIKETSEVNRRSVLGLLIVTGGAELLNRAAVSGLQLGPFQITDLSVIRIILPLAAAYLVYDIITNSIRNIYSQRLLSRINQIFRPALYDAQYARLTYPQGSSLFGPLVWYEAGTRTYGTVRNITAVLRAGSILTPLVLISYWYVRLFQALGYANLLLWISVTVAAGFIAFSIVLLLEAMRSNLIGSFIVSRSQA